MWKRKYGIEQILLVFARLSTEVVNRFGADDAADMIVVGGAAFMLEGLTTRTLTKDVDIIQADGRILESMHSITCMNLDSAVFLDCLPYCFEDRLEVVELNLPGLRVLRPSLEDMVVMKLRSYRDNDRVDITSPNVLKSISWDKLNHLIYDPNEAMASCMADLDYRMLVLKYEEYRKAFGPEAIMGVNRVAAENVPGELRPLPHEPEVTQATSAREYLAEEESCEGGVLPTHVGEEPSTPSTKAVRRRRGV